MFKHFSFGDWNAELFFLLSFDANDLNAENITILFLRTKLEIHLYKAKLKKKNPASGSYDGSATKLPE